MSFIVARVSKLQEEYYKILAFDEEDELPYINKIEINNSVEYDSRYKLEEDECYKINQFSSKDYFLEFIGKPINSTSLKKIPKGSVKDIEFFFLVHENKLYFQRVTPSQFIKQQFWSINKDKIVTEEDTLTIKNIPDAVYDIESDTLYFKNLINVKGIFNNIDTLFKEATRQEVNSFLNQSFISLENGYNESAVKTLNRKRISLIQEILENVTPKELASIIDYVREYCEELNYNEEEKVFYITKEKDLTDLLYGIDQRYYTTKVGGEKRIANSIKRLG